MKKTLISIFMAVLMFFVSFSAYADQDIEIKMIIDNPKVLVNGREVTLDVPPTIMNGRTLVPIRFISETLGALVEYDAPTRTVTIRMPNLKTLKEKLTQLEEKIEELIDAHKNQLQELKEDLEASEQTIEELLASIETIQEALEQKELELQNRISYLEELIEDLEDKLANAGKGLEEESNVPVIEISNLQEGQSISEELNLRGSIQDESPIAYVRVSIGSKLIYEGKTIGGTLNPYQLISGGYVLKVEAIDAFGNNGQLKLNIKIANSPKDEPVKLTSKVMDLAAMGGEGAYLFATISNKSLSYLEVLKAETFDSKGNRVEIMPGIGFLDFLKMQFDMEHMLVQYNDRISFPVAADMENSGKPAKDYFNQWKIRITCFDPVMEKEFLLETTFTS